MILEFIPHSHSKSATCKYRREDRMRIRSHRCTVFGSVGDSRKPVVGQWWSPENPARTERTYSGWCLEDGTSKSFWVGNCRILFLEEMLLQERELCTLQGVMDANNFNILWTEASWIHNKTLIPHYPNQGNYLYLKQTPSKTHNLILLKEILSSISNSDQEKKKRKTACLGETPTLFCVVTK